MKTSEQINELAKAMAAAQREIKTALKDSNNPFFKSKYADLSSIWLAAKEPLTSRGLAVFQDVTTSENTVDVTTRIVHESGQWMEFGPLSLPILKKDPQSMGSLCSYGRRYSLASSLSIVTGDDDGEETQRQFHDREQEENPTVKTVSKEQADELKNMADQLPSEIKTNVIEMVKKNHRADNWFKLPATAYSSMKRTIQNSLNELQKKTAA